MTKITLRLGSKKVPVETNRFLQRGKPQTVTDSGGTLNGYSWQGQELDRGELRKVKEIREKGGLVSWLFEAKALMKFGTGAELQTENDDLQEWLNDNFENLDLLTLDLGSDGIWYPYGLGETVETRGGEFSHIECIEPWTMLPRTDEYGTIQAWEQETQNNHTDIFQPEEIGSIVLNKSSGRDKVGVSEVLRSEEEITQYKENQRAVNKAIEIAGFPHHVWTVGAEGRSPVDDNDLRRVRNLIDNMDGDTQFVVGPDVNHDKITAADFDFEGVTKRDLRVLTTTIGLPMEVAGYGREGMGSGSEAALIKDMLALQNEVSRRRFETQFVSEFVKPVVEQYSPYNAENEEINMVINPFLDERDDVADLIAKIGEYMTTAEVRDKLDLPPVEDDEIAESYRSPESVEESEEGDGGGSDPFGGLLGESVENALEARGLSDLRELEDFDANLFELVATEEQEDFETGARLGIGVEFPNSGVYVDWNIDAWPEEERLDGPHVSEYSTVDDAQKVAQGEVRELQAAELEDGGTGNLKLVDESTPDFDRHYLGMLEGHAWADATDRTLVGFSDGQVPDMVTERIQETIWSGEAIFSSFESVPSSELMQLREFMAEQLADQDGWTTDGLADRLMDLDGLDDRDRALNIARTETASIVNTSRQSAYEERGLADEPAFKWTGTDEDGTSDNHRTTRACGWLKEKTNPKFGGTPVTLERLKELIDEAPSHDPDMDSDLARPNNFVVHPRERHTFTRHVE